MGASVSDLGRRDQARHGPTPSESESRTRRPETWWEPASQRFLLLPAPFMRDPAKLQCIPGPGRISHRPSESLVTACCLGESLDTACCPLCCAVKRCVCSVHNHWWCSETPEGQATDRASDQVTAASSKTPRAFLPSPIYLSVHRPYLSRRTARRQCSYCLDLNYF